MIAEDAILGIALRNNRIHTIPFIENHIFMNIEYLIGESVILR